MKENTKLVFLHQYNIINSKTYYIVNYCREFVENSICMLFKIS